MIDPNHWLLMMKIMMCASAGAVGEFAVKIAKGFLHTHPHILERLL